MPNRLWIAVLVLAAGCAPDRADQSSPTEVDVHAFVDVTVISMVSPEPIPNSTVIVAGNEIVQVGPAGDVEIPAGATRVDGRGKYLLPGLADMHSHSGYSYNPDEPRPQADLLLYLATGVTTIRNAAGSPGLKALEQAVKEGSIFGPRLETASPLLEGEDAVWEFSTKVLTADQARDTVRQIKSDGYESIKIYHTLSREAYEAIMDEATNLDIPVFGHVPFEVGIEEILAYRQASIEHLRGYDIDGLSLEALEKDGGRSAERFESWLKMSDERMDELVALTVEAGTWNCPTFVVVEMLIDADKLDDYADHPMATYMPPELMTRFRESGLEELFSTESRAMLDRARPQMLKFLKKLHDAGAPLMTGTDTFPSLVPGFTLIDELETFVEAGLTPYEALQYSTVYPARYLGKEGNRGTVARGMTADLILVAADPLEDVNNLWQLDGVMIDGAWLSRAELLAMLKAHGGDVSAESP